MVVDYVCEVVGRHSVGFDEYVVLKLPVFDGDFSENGVHIAAHALVGHFLPDDVRLPRRDFCGNLLLAQFQAVSVVTARAVHVGQRLQPLLGAKTKICVPLLHKLQGVLHVIVFALALHVRSELPADVGTFVVNQPRLLHGFEYVLHAALDKTLPVGVLYPQNKPPARLFGVKIRVKRGAQTADMQIARRAWRKTCPYHKKRLLFSTKYFPPNILAHFKTFNNGFERVEFT